jgi:hypothetical protein
MTQNDILITLCGDGSYCCGYNNTACCATGGGYWVSNGKVYPYSSSTFTSATNPPTQSTASMIPTSSLNVSNSNDPNVSRGNNSNISSKVALGVGLGIGIPIILLLIAVVLLRRRNRITTPNATDARAGTIGTQDPKLASPNRVGWEANTTGTGVEMMATQDSELVIPNRAELEVLQRAELGPPYRAELGALYRAELEAHC